MPRRQQSALGRGTDSQMISTACLCPMVSGIKIAIVEIYPLLEGCVIKATSFGGGRLLTNQCMEFGAPKILKVIINSTNSFIL